MKKRKIFILFIGLLIVLGLSACGEKKEKTLEDIIIGTWKIEQYEDDEFIYDEEGRVIANGINLGIYSVSENTLKINYTDGTSVIEQAKIYGEDEFAMIYVKQESATGEVIDENSYDENYLRYHRKTSDSEQLALKDVIVGTWTVVKKEDRENEEIIPFIFCENGDYKMAYNMVNCGTYSITGNTLTVTYNDVAIEEFETKGYQCDIEEYSENEFTISNAREISLDGELIYPENGETGTFYRLN